MARPKGGYKNAAGQRVPGVTTIVGRFKESGGLLQWAFQQGLAGMGSLYEKRDEAADAGTLAHEMVEAHIKGQDDKTVYALADDGKDEVGVQAIQAYEAYLTWARHTKLKIVEQETPLVSEEYQFGGTLDAIGEIDGDLCLVDWKTSNSVYQDYLIQLAAYKHLWESAHHNQPLTGGFHLCRFAKTHGDFAHHFYPKLDEAWRQFVLFREAYEIDKQLKARAK